MAKRPADRYADAAAMRAALENVRQPADRSATPGWQMADLLVAAPVLAAAPARLVRAFSPARRAELASWARDWRGWVTLSCLCAASALAFRAVGPSTNADEPAPTNSNSATADSAAVTPGSLGALALAAANDTVRPGRAIGPGGAAAPSNGRPVAPFAGGGGEPITLPGTGNDPGPAPVQQNPAAPERPAPKKEPPREPDRTPAVVSEPPEREALPSEAERRRLAQAAAVEFLGRLAGGDGSVGGALSGGGTTGDLLTLVREGRLASSTTRDLSLTLSGGDRAEAIAHLQIAYRTPFGGKREGNVRLSVQLVSDSGRWRVTAARVVSGSLR